MRRTRTHSAILAILLAGSLGCASSEEEPATVVSAGGEEAAPAVGPVLTLIDAGAEPRSPLRYDVEQGSVAQVAIDLVISLSSTIGGFDAEVEAAPTRFLFQVGPVQRIGDDRLSYQIRISDVQVSIDAELDDEAVELVQQMLEPLTTVTGWLQIDTTGVVRSASLDVPAEMGPRTRTALANVWTGLVSVPLPQEAVGLGAQWQVTRPVELPNVTVDQTTTYTVTEMSEGGVGLQVSMRQSAAPQDLRGLGAGESGRVETYEASGIGHVAVDLHRVVATGDLDATTDLRGSVTSEGETAPVRIQMRTQVQAHGGP